MPEATLPSRTMGQFPEVASASTNAGGEYRISNLLPGNYDVSAGAPGFSTFNVSVSKNTYFGETKYLQLRADVFNILNHPSYTLTNGNVFNASGIASALSNAGYSQPSDAAFLNAKNFGGGIRQMTLGIKFIF